MNSTRAANAQTHARVLRIRARTLKPAGADL
jgi:hypothetical protein